MFILIHSPCPLVSIFNGTHYNIKGETNLKFIWYAFSHANRGLKNFNNIKQLKLPNFESPKQVL